MIFNDDELPPAISSSAGPKASLQADRVRVVAYSNDKAPLEQNMQQVLVEVIDTSSAAERSGLDLVAVLDVSGSMSLGNKLEKMKTAMKFVIGKLGPMDRLCIVSFSDEANTWYPLQCMTRANQEKLKDLVENRLGANGGTNMEDGLRTGLQFLAGRRHSTGRIGSIILMSDGIQDEDSKAELVDNICDAAVYTFGFGEDNDAEVLATIASKSQGGTFYYVRDGESLSEHFSQILAGLLSVVVQDLRLTVWQQDGHSVVHQVDASAYRVERTPSVDGQDASVTVNFGDLYSGEVRKAMVDLVLPAVHREYNATVLFAQCWYSVKGKAFYSPGVHLGCVIRRTRTARPDAVKPEVKAELVRRRYVITLREAIELKDMDRAKRKLEDTNKDLVDAEQQQQSSSNSTTMIIGILRMELTLLLSLETWKELLACLLASWTSHHRQRFAARGYVRRNGMFRTPRMDTYMAQATAFDKNPDAPLPSVEEDVKKEEEEEARKRHSPLLMADHRRRPMWVESEERSRSCSGWAWRLVILLCTVLAIAVIVAGAVLFAVFLLYKPKMPRLVVSDARLVQLQYDQAGTMSYVQVAITILAENNNSKADASFSGVDLALGFHGADVALLRAAPFVVPRESFLPLRYNVVSAGQSLDPDGMQAMDEALKDGVLPLDLFGKARTKWKVGVFVNLKFWTRVSCRLRFFYPGNGTVMTADRQKCRSRSP